MRFKMSQDWSRCLLCQGQFLLHQQCIINWNLTTRYVTVYIWLELYLFPKVVPSGKKLLTSSLTKLVLNNCDLLLLLFLAVTSFRGLPSWTANRSVLEDVVQQCCLSRTQEALEKKQSIAALKH